jgi:predicted N-acetyltransferase YhbS
MRKEGRRRMRDPSREPAEAFMAMELKEESLESEKGAAEYPDEFFKV